MTMDQQIEELLELNAALEAALAEKDLALQATEERLEELQQLRKGTVETDLDALWQQNDHLRKDLDDARAEVLTLKSENTNLQAQKQFLEEQSSSKDTDIRELKKKMEQARDQFLKDLQRAKEEAQRSQEFDHTRRQTQSEFLQVLEENQSLRDKVQERESELETLTEMQNELLEALETLHSDQEAAVSEKEEFALQAMECKHQLEELEASFLAVQAKLEQSGKNLIQAQGEMKAFKDQLLVQSQQFTQKLADKDGIIHELKRDLRKLREETIISQKDQEISELRSELLTQKSLMEAMQKARAKASLDVENLANTLQDTQSHIQDRVTDIVSQERVRNKVLELRIEALEARVKEEEHKNMELESHTNQITRSLEECEQWKASYELGHGMRDAVRYQKRLQADIQRRDAEIARLVQILGEERDDKEKLYHTCQKLKQEAGHPPDFLYDATQLREEIKTDNARLQGVNAELNKQIDALEQERIRLLLALRDNAAQISEKGFKFLNLTADQIAKVNEFARNLRDGVVKLPMDNRSSELFRNNQELNQTIQILQSKISQLEIVNYSAPVIVGPETVERRDEVGLELRRELERLTEENRQLQTKLQDMQEELMNSIQDLKPLGLRPMSAEPPTSDVSARQNELLLRLHKQNERLMEEIHDLREQNKQQTTLLAMPQASLRPTTGSTTSRLHPNRPNLTVQTQPVSSVPSTGAVVDAMHLPLHGLATRLIIPPGTPQTPHGQNMLRQNMSRLQLPPEEWAEEVKEMYAQLVEVLEQLSEREAEIEEQHEVITEGEKNMIHVKQQLTALYTEYVAKLKEFNEKTNAMNEEHRKISFERDDLKVKVEKFEQYLKLLDQEDDDETRKHLRDVTRQIAVHEVNTNILVRKYTSLREQLDVQTSSYSNLVHESAEMEHTLKCRVLFLEQFKTRAHFSLARIQKELDESVPLVDFENCTKELEHMREEYLRLLEQDIDCSVYSLKCHEYAKEIRRLKHCITDLQTEIVASREEAKSAVAQLEEEKTLREMALAASLKGDLSELVSKCARYRGEVARLEVEIEAAKKKNEFFNQDLLNLERENESHVKRIQELEMSTNELRQKDGELRAEAQALLNRYEGGLARTEADDVKATLERRNQEIEKLTLATQRYKELSEISAAQAQALATARTLQDNEMAALKAHIADVESRSEDSVTLGRVSRQLIASKQAHALLARKYEAIRTSLRNKHTQLKVLELKYDDVQENFSKAKELHRLQVRASKKALLTLMDTDINGFNSNSPTSLRVPARISRRLNEVTVRVAELTTGCTRVHSDMRDIEGERNRLEEANTSLQIERDTLQQLVQDLQRLIVNSSLEQGEYPLPHQNQPNRSAVAARLIAVTHELQTNKLSTYKLRRQVSVLRDEKAYLEGMCGKLEEDLTQMEATLVRQQTQAQAAVVSVISSEQHGESEFPKRDMTRLADWKEYARAYLTEDGQIRSESNADGLSSKTGPEILSQNTAHEYDQLLSHRNALQQQLVELQNELASMRALNDRYKSEVEEARGTTDSHARLMRHYEILLQQHGIPTMANALQGSPSTRVGPKRGALQLENKAGHQLQEAANATISSLRALLDEKDRAIDKLKTKVHELQSQRRAQSKADMKAERLIREVEAQAEHQVKPQSRRLSTPSGATKGVEEGVRAHTVLMEQVEELTVLLAEKNDTIKQLEQRLSAANNKHEIAERRCGETLEEMENMKADLVTLAHKLQESDNELHRILSDQTQAQEVHKLQMKLKGKDTKLQGLRKAVIRLKEEFVRAEERHAKQAITQQQAQTNVNAELERTSAGTASSQLDDMRANLHALKEGLKQAKEDLDAAKRNREKLLQAKRGKEMELEGIETEMRKLEKSNAEKDEIVFRTRRELEESQRQVFRLKEKLKETAQSDGKEGNEHDEPVKQVSRLQLQTRVTDLERANKLLAAQNEALRSALGSQPNKPFTVTSSKDRPSLEEGAREQDMGTSLSAQAVGRWEAEKRIVKRLATLEKRLKEKTEDHDAISEKLRHTREMLVQAQQDKEMLSKKQEALSVQLEQMNKITSADVMSVESMRARVFALENENAELQRRVEIEAESEIAQWRHKANEWRGRANELEAEVEEIQRERKRLVAAGDTMRENEQSYLREERMKDEIKELRKQIRSLEAQSLDRDAVALELKFDVEARTAEVLRLRRRNREMQDALETLTQKDSASVGVTITRAAGDRFKRERDLEGVIENMRKVIDRLKAENERLRASNNTSPSPGPVSTSGSRVSVPVLEKKLREQRERVTVLERQIEENNRKIEANRDLGQRMAQRQQQVVSLKRQLKTKEDEVHDLQERVRNADAKVQTLTHEYASARARTRDLEDQLTNQQVPANVRTHARDEEVLLLRTTIEEQRRGLEARALVADRGQVQKLEQELRNARREVDEMRERFDDMDVRLRKAAGANAALREENAKLSEELSAFDLDFFEEIEDLKYKYAEACQRLSVYEGTH